MKATAAAAAARAEPEAASASVAAKATRREIFAYLLLFFRSVVQLISAAMCTCCEVFQYPHSEAR